MTQQMCNEEAERITGMPVLPSTVQGGSSYTVVAGESIVQFRVPRSALDLDLLGYVEQAYAGFTPRHSSAGREGELYIYTMNNVEGISMYLARNRLFRDNYCLLRETLKDYAR